MFYDPEKVTYFAETDARGKRVKFGIKAKDRERHMYVIGKTGMGKSTMLENMAIQDIQNGEGIAFIDPHGSTAEKLLDYVPEHRIKDVLYFAPFDMDNPVAFNVMEDVGYDKRHLVVSGLMSTFKKIFVDQWSARMEYILSNTLLALLEYPGSTLLGVNRMLSDKAYREMVVNNVKDPAVRSFWVDEFAKYNERYMQEAGDAIKNKIGQFTANPVIRNIIGQSKSSFDVREIMDGKKIMIMNLSKGLIGETNANLLGSMLITRIYISAMSRADLSAAELNKAPRFYFYVDEFQSFANETFANILSEARKYKLNLTIAHQYIEQMEEEVRNAVFGNVGTTISFRVGPFDAEVLETVFSPEFLATDIVNLGYTQIYLTLMIDGIGSRPFSATTLPPIVPDHISYKDMIVMESRKQFAYTRADIESQIKIWHEPIKKPEVVRAPSATSASAGTHSSVHTKTYLPPVRTFANHGAKQPNPTEHTIEPVVEKKPDIVTPQAPYSPKEYAHESKSTHTSVATPKATEHRPPYVKKPYEKPISREQRPHTPHQKVHTVPDLKSVLRSAMGTESKPSASNTASHTTERRMHNKPPHSKEPSADAKNDLRSALASVMNNPPQRIPEPTAVLPPEEKTFAKQAETLGEVKETSTVTATPIEVATQAPEMENTQSDVDRKTLQKLEKILRSKGNDKPPLG